MDRHIVWSGWAPCCSACGEVLGEPPDYDEMDFVEDDYGNRMEQSKASMEKDRWFVEQVEWNFKYHICKGV